MKRKYTRKKLETHYRAQAEALIHEDILRLILPSFEHGGPASGGCRTLEEVREWVNACIHDDEGPETYTEEDAEGVSMLLLEDVYDTLEDADEGIRDREEIEDTNRWIHRKLCREGNSGGCSW